MFDCFRSLFMGGGGYLFIHDSSLASACESSLQRLSARLHVVPNVCLAFLKYWHVVCLSIVLGTNYMLSTTCMVINNLYKIMMTSYGCISTLQAQRVMFRKELKALHQWPILLGIHQLLVVSQHIGPLMQCLCFFVASWIAFWTNRSMASEMRCLNGHVIPS